MTPIKVGVHEGMNVVYTLGWNTALNDRPSFLHYADSNLESSKNTCKTIISTANSPIFCSTKFTVKSMNWLECIIQNGDVRVQIFLGT